MTSRGWTKQPSERLKRQQQPTQPQSQSKGKGQEQQNSIPKSQIVKDLEKILNGIKADKNAKDPEGGCFCQAREHKLSSYTPICFTCGLILCSLNLPYYTCPSCSTSLLSQPSTSTQLSNPKDTLIAKFQSDIDAQLAKELADRERAIEQARRAVGDFPTLGVPSPGQGNSPVGSGRNTPASSSYKVLSLTSKPAKGGGKARSKVTSTTHSSPASSTPDLHSALALANLNAVVDPAPPPSTRVPAPPTEDVYFGQYEGKWDKSRPWKEVRMGGVSYVQAPKKAEDGKDGTGRKRRRKGKGEGGKENASGEAGGWNAEAGPSSAVS